ncbi:hypothetical protein B0H11DRAFT_1814028 [Mycena galericulata]|nr:hypothetical protein B0H11DRAFT_1814028 [Mycena galericulata]
MSSINQKADALKDKGNVAFKEGKMLEASILYAKAESAAPQENVYPANLSAALYELGDYAGTIDAIARSWKLGTPSPNLALRLSVRAAKALAHGVRGDTIGPDALAKHAQVLEQLENVALQQGNAAGVDTETESVRVWREWRAIAREGGDRSAAAHEARVRLADIPIVRPGVNPMLQYYTIGQDEMLSLFDDWGPKDPNPLNIGALSKARLSELSFFFGGVGDARNAYATLIGGHRAYKTLPKDKRSAMRMHLTLLDIHPSALARDLVVLMLLNDCMAPNVAPDALAEIKATLMYTYAGGLMPPYAYACQQKTIKSLLERLAAVPPRLPPWLHVSRDGIPAIRASLAYWADNPNKTARGMLAAAPTGAPAPTILDMLDNPGLTPAYRAILQNQIQPAMRQISGVVDALGPSEARAMMDAPAGWSDARVVAELKARRPTIVQTLLKEHLSGNAPPRLSGEAVWFQVTGTLVPPKELWAKHPGIEYWDKNRRGLAPFPERVKTQLQATVEKTWKPNMTLFDREYSELSRRSLPNCKGYPDLPLDGMILPRLFDMFNRRFSIDKGGELRADPESPVYTHTMRFFQGVINALKALEGSVKLEVICGGLMEELGKLRLGTDTSRPAKFPRTFTRAYLSNVPDYTHGVLNTAVFVVPCLQRLPDSVVGSNSLLNSAVWKDDDEFCHNYSLLHPKDVPRFLGCETVRMDGIMGITSLRKRTLPLPLAELAPRLELTRWLTRVLLYTCVPGTASTAGPMPMPMRMPNNLVAFIHLLIHLHAVGYPAHWLSELLSSILTDTLATDVSPYLGTFPIPLSDRTRTVPTRRVRLEPWHAELEGILAAALRGLPFAVPLPPGFPASHTEIRIYEAAVQLNGPDLGPRFVTAGPQDNVVGILLFRPSSAFTAAALIKLIPSILEGQVVEPRRGAVCVISSPERVDIPGRKVSWRISRERVRRMRAEGWVMVVYRTDNKEAVTLPLPAAKWTEMVDEPDLD